MTRPDDDLFGPSYRSAADLGFAPSSRPAQISRIEPQSQQLPETIGGWDDSLGSMHVPATSHTSGSHQDRAKGFAIATKHLSACSAVAIIPVAVVGFGFPLLSMPILAWMFGTYASVWALAYIWHQATSADGVSWFTAFYRFWIAITGLRMSYRLIKADQKHRHEKEVRLEQ